MKTFTSNTSKLSEASNITYGFSSANRAAWLVPDSFCTEEVLYDEDGIGVVSYTVDIKSMMMVEWVLHRSVLMDDGQGDRPEVSNMLSGGKHGPVGPCFHYWKHPDL